MRHLILLIFVAVCTVSAPAQESFIDKLGNIKGVSSVYVTKSLLSMMPDAAGSGQNFGAVADKLDDIQILNSESRQAAKALREGCLQIIRNGKYKKLMNVNDSGEQSGIYMKTYSKNKHRYVMLTVESEEVNVIVFTGNLTLNDIKKVIGN